MRGRRRSGLAVARCPPACAIAARPRVGAPSAEGACEPPDVTESASGTRFDGIDGVRAFAVLAVIAAHAHVFWMHGGGVGVDIFFGISGFLITFLLLQERARFGRVSLVRFWLRRALRLLPALLLLVGSIDAVAVTFGSFHPKPFLTQSLMATPSVLFYFSNWMIVATNSAALGWFGPLWSLSVEEQFYVLWPLVLVAAMMWTRLRLGFLALIAAAGVLAAATGRFLDFDGANVYRTFGTDFRVDMLLVGALLAIAFHANLGRVIFRLSGVLVWPAIVFLVAVSLFVPEFGAPGSAAVTREYYVYGLPLVALGTASVVGFLVTHQSSRLVQLLSFRPIAYTGVISYGIYLWHYPILQGLGALGVRDPFVLFLLTVVLTYPTAALSWRLLERPLQARFSGYLKPVRMGTRGAGGGSSTVDARGGARVPTPTPVEVGR